MVCDTFQFDKHLLSSTFSLQQCSTVFIRMLPRVIGYFFIKRFNIQIKFGRVGFPFTLRAVTIIKNGFSIVSFQFLQIKFHTIEICKCHVKLQQIDEITIRSSFFNSDVSKLLSIAIRDIRVNKDINDTVPTDSKIVNQPNNGDDSIDQNLNVCDFRDKKVPPSIIKFAQVSQVLMKHSCSYHSLHHLIKLLVVSVYVNERAKYICGYDEQYLQSELVSSCDCW